MFYSSNRGLFDQCTPPDLRIDRRFAHFVDIVVISDDHRMYYRDFLNAKIQRYWKKMSLWEKFKPYAVRGIFELVMDKTQLRKEKFRSIR